MTPVPVDRVDLTVRPRPVPDLEVVVDHLSVEREPVTPPPSGPRDRRSWLIPGTAALCLLLAGVPGTSAGSAPAPGPRTVAPAAELVLAGHPAVTPVRLIGASEHGVAVWQGAPAGTAASPTIYTGALAGRDGTLRLTARPGAGAGSSVRLSVAGPVLARYERGERGYGPEKRLDLATGEDVTTLRSGSLAVRQPPLGGEATTPYTEVGAEGRLTRLRAGRLMRFAEVSARFVRHDGRWTLRYGSGGPRVALPAGITPDSGLDAVDDRLYTVSGGERPAVYVIQGRSVTRVADIPPARYPITSFSLSAGTLHYTDQSTQRSTVFSSPVRVEAGTIGLGNSVSLRQRAGGSPSSVPISFSAGRGVIAGPGAPRQWQLIDEGRATALIGQRPVEIAGRRQFVDDRSPAASGAYLLVGGQVFRSDGELLWTEPGAAALAREDDLYGSNVVYSVAAGGTDDGGHDLAGVWSVDVERPLPVRLDPGACESAPQVAIWAVTAAWTNCDGDRITVQDLRTGAIRDVPADPVDRLTLREGVLAWRAGDALTLLDLSDPGSEPVALTGSTTGYALDGDLVARRVRRDGSSQVVVDRLPFRVSLRPRVISAAAPLGFTPDGDGEFDTWQPQFDLTRPVRDAVLRIMGPSGRVVRTIRVEGSGASLRGIRWDGRAGSGARLPIGQYTWELTARAVDSSGTLTSVDGEGREQGPIEISSVAS